jgi:hypothetical protein
MKAQGNALGDSLDRPSSPKGAAHLYKKSMTHRTSIEAKRDMDIALAKSELGLPRFPAENRHHLFLAINKTPLSRSAQSAA